MTDEQMRGRHSPMARHDFEYLEVEGSLRHYPEKPHVEPKVYSPYKAKPGHIPRQIVVERRKRQFASVDINEHFRHEGVLEKLKKSFQQARRDSVDQMPLSLFDDELYHSRPVKSWFDYIDAAKPSGGLKARAIFHHKSTDNYFIDWRRCFVYDYHRETKHYRVAFALESYNSTVLVADENNTTFLEAIYVCFDAEDPELYCARVQELLYMRDRTAAGLALNLYVDCMPVDNLKPLDSEQVTRILANAINTDKLRSNSMLDTSSLLQQYNLNHMRSLNQMMFVDLLRKQRKNMESVKSASTDATLFPSLNEVFIFREKLIVEAEAPFEERFRIFKFASLLSKPEAMHILQQIQIDNIPLEKISFFSSPEKSMRLEEFNTNHQAAAFGV
jgi:dynein heavy chain